jgi:hypothetical protein
MDTWCSLLNLFIETDHYQIGFISLNKKAPHKRGMAFGIDRNQESFLRRKNNPADATKVVVSCKNFFDPFSSGL